MKLIEEGFLKRNRKLILIATLILLVSAIAGALISYSLADGKYNVISNLMRTHPANLTNASVDINPIELFAHNLIADLLVIIGGIFISITSVLIIIYNGLSIGSIFGVDLPYAAITILPHGIIEYFASALSLVIAFKITKLEIRIIKNRNLKNTLKEHRIDLKDILVILIVIIILLAIASFIEAYVVQILTKWYFGLS